MAKVLMSQDVLGICLLVAGGDLNMTMEEVMKLVDEFEEQKRCRFGSSQGDLPSLFISLVLQKLGPEKFSFPYRLILGKVNLQDVALDVLSFQGYWSCDEGDYWIDYEQEPTYHTWFPNFYDCTLKEFEAKQAVRKEMIEFFKDLKGKSCPLRQVQDMLFKLGFNLDTLYACSR